ncbi:MAG: ATP-binding cassette domain-containing protein, partial [Thermodesulfobacteriota bacterium]
MNSDNTLVSIKNIVKHFDISGGILDQLKFKNFRLQIEKTSVKAVNNVSLDIQQGENLSVVGESGCGKSTIARVIMGLYPPNSGEIYYDGKRIDNLTHEQMLPFRKK